MTRVNLPNPNAAYAGQRTLSRVTQLCATLSLVIVMGLSACVQSPSVHTLDASTSADSAATLVGSRTSDGAYSFEYYAVDQINYNNARGRFSSFGSSPDEFKVLLAPRTNNVWVEGRVRAGLGVPAKRVAAMLSFTAVPRTQYQIVGRASADSAYISIVNLTTKEIVASVDSVVFTLPPPGYPTQFIPIFIGR